MSIDRGATTLAIFTRSRGAWAIPLPTASATQVTLFSDDFETAKAVDDDRGHGNVRLDEGPTAGAHSPDNCVDDASLRRTTATINLTSPPISGPGGLEHDQALVLARSTTPRATRTAARRLSVRLRLSAALDRRTAPVHEHRQPLRGSGAGVLPVDGPAAGFRSRARRSSSASTSSPTRRYPTRFTRAGGSTTCRDRGAELGVSVWTGAAAAAAPVLLLRSAAASGASRSSAHRGAELGAQSSLSRAPVAAPAGYARRGRRVVPTPHPGWGVAT